MLKIIGWIIVVWLFGNTIYSSQFHLRNYFQSKGNATLIAKDLDGPGQEVLMNKTVFFKRVLGMQVIKIGIMSFLVYLLLKW